MTKDIKRKVNNKLKSKAGESIAETLVALLISALALVMLAGAVTASANIIMLSREKLGRYYDANEYVAKLSGVIPSDKSDDVGKTDSGSVTLTMGEGDDAKSVTYNSLTIYENKVFSKNPVKAYKKSGS